MGDTGALALGGAVAGLSVLTQTQLLAVVIGGLFVLVVLSDVIQIGVFKASAQLSAEQAKRDAVLAFRQEIGAELTKLLAQDTHKALDDKALAALITAALQGEDASAYAAEVASVTDALKSELAGELKAGLELRLSKKVHTGFRLCAKDGSGYIDCSDEELAEQLAPFFRELRI